MIALREILLAVIARQGQSPRPGEPCGRVPARPERGLPVVGGVFGFGGVVGAVGGGGSGEIVAAQIGRAREGEVAEEKFANTEDGGYKVEVECWWGGIPRWREGN